MTFFWTTSTLLLSLFALVAAIICCSISWKRSGYSRSVGFLEALRLLLIIMAVITLNQPELLQEFRPEEQPSLVVLYDTSESMRTRDVLNPKKSADPPITRKDAVAALTQNATSEEDTSNGKDNKKSESKRAADAKLWEPISKRMNVVFEPFSSKLTNPTQGTDLNQALLEATQKHNNLRGIVLISDGDWNTGKAPNSAATTLRMKSIPVFSVGVGSEEHLPDIELASIDAPTFGVVGKTIRIPFKILNWLPRDRDINVTLSGTRGEKIVKTVRVNGMGQLRETLNWRPQKIGEYKLAIDIPVDQTEINPENNRIEFPISIKNEALKVLIVESYPRWEYRYLRNALERDPGVEVNCLLFHPDLKGVGGGRGYLDEFPGEKNLFKYDVVFLGDVGVESNQLSLENCQHLRQLVRSHAGGLIFLPGFRGKQATLLTTELEELYPVLLDQGVTKGYGLPFPARFTLTESGRRSLLTRLELDERENESTWNNLPGFQWYAAALRAKIGSQVLATHDSESTRHGRVPLIVTRTSGTGKVLFMGTDGAWRWRKGVEDLYHYRFWGQVVRWMAYQRNMSKGEAMRLFYSPDRPEANRVITLNANVMSSGGEPLRKGTVVVQITSPSGQVESVRLAPAGDDSWGLFTETFTPKQGGIYKLLTTCKENGAKLETTISVQGVEREQIGEPARFDVLKEISQVSKGKLTSIDDIQEMIDSIAKMPEPKPIIRRFRLWSNPIWGGSIVLLLTIFWIGRKLAGLA